jgi:hypothetical protein
VLMGFNPNHRVNSDPLSMLNSTNLAIKGIIGIKAVSQISQILGRAADSQHYEVCTSSVILRCRAILSHRVLRPIMWIHGCFSLCPSVLRHRSIFCPAMETILRLGCWLIICSPINGLEQILCLTRYVVFCYTYDPMFID